MISINAQLTPASPADGLERPRAERSDAERTAFRWVPIRSLGVRHRERVKAHLQTLSTADRYLRFGHAASDAQIARYVDGIDFTRDEVFGIFNRRLELIAMAHLAYEPRQQVPTREAMVEFGVSVLQAARSRGYGARLFEHAVMHARNRGTDTLFIHALSENTAMLKIARRAGATVERDGSESQAWLKLPPDTLASQFEQLVDTQAAELNYRFKQQAIRLEHLIDAVRELKDQLAKTGGAASQ